MLFSYSRAVRVEYQANHVKKLLPRHWIIRFSFDLRKLIMTFCCFIYLGSSDATLGSFRTELADQDQIIEEKTILFIFLSVESRINSISDVG